MIESLKLIAGFRREIPVTQCLLPLPVFICFEGGQTGFPFLLPLLPVLFQLFIPLQPVAFLSNCIQLFFTIRGFLQILPDGSPEGFFFFFRQ